MVIIRTTLFHNKRRSKVTFTITFHSILKQKHKINPCFNLQQTNSDQQEMSKSFFDGEKCASVVFVEVSGVANQPNPLKQQQQQQQQQQRIKDFLSRELPEKSTQKMPEVHSMKHREEKVKHTFEKWRNRTYSGVLIAFLEGYGDYYMTLKCFNCSLFLSFQQEWLKQRLLF